VCRCVFTAVRKDKKKSGKNDTNVCVGGGRYITGNAGKRNDTLTEKTQRKGMGEIYMSSFCNWDGVRKNQKKGEAFYWGVVRTKKQHVLELVVVPDSCNPPGGKGVY